MTATRAEAAAGLAIPRVIRKRLAGAGNAPTMGTAAGMAIATVTPKPRAVAGSVLTMARAAGLATPKAIRTPLAGAGRTDIDPNAATMRMDAAEAAPARMSSVAGPATTMIGAAKADAAVARRATMIVVRPHPDGVMAGGRAILRAMPRLPAVGGKTAVNLATLRLTSSWRNPGAGLSSRRAIMPSSKAKGLEDLFADTLKDIYFAEKQILRALPKMAKSASSQELSQAFESIVRKRRGTSSVSKKFLRR